MPRPNFLLFITDQQRADHLGCGGNGVVRTPNIDSIAERGLVFDRCYVATPSCQPNRATLATGRMPSVHGVRMNGIPLSLRTTTFMDLLRAADYRTALIGKAHLQNLNDRSVEHGNSEQDGYHHPPSELAEAIQDKRTGQEYQVELADLWRQQPDRHVNLPYYGFEHVRLCSMHGDFVEGHYTRWLAERSADSDALRGPDNAIPDDRYSAPQCWRTRMPEELYPTNYVAEETIAFLQTHAKDHEAEPFFIQCSFPDPHHPFTPPGKYWDMYDPADVPLPVSFDQKVDEELPNDAAIRGAYDTGRANRNMYGPTPVSRREAQEIIALNYGMISMVDDAVGRVLTTLSSLGFKDNTVVIFTSDHGDYMGDHGVILKGGLHYHGLVRVPFIWSDPVNGFGTGRSQRLTGTIDIGPTILDRAKLMSYRGTQGRNAISDPQRNGLVIEDYAGEVIRGSGINDGMLTYMTDQWRLTTFESSSWGQLFDLREDPDELSNLWNDSRHQSIKRFRTVLHRG